MTAALYALPDFFQTELVISGVRATDLFTFNASLGATIETQVVEALNRQRGAWDPDQQYAAYRFVRQAQRFPDVILRSSLAGSTPEILMGIELKGWYVLAKESEPSFRYRATPAVCAPQDLLVVFPWCLSNVIAGAPQLFTPYVVPARYAAEYRNWHWQHARTSRTQSGIELAQVATFYPNKTDAIADVPLSDRGNNFGRLARTGLMDPFIAQLNQQELSGIPIGAWQRFLKIFSENQSEAAVLRHLDRLAAEYQPVSSNPQQSERLDLLLREIMLLLSQ